MPASALLVSYHGAGGTTTNITGVEMRYKCADNDQADLNDPILIPSSGSNFSMVKHMKIQFTTSPAVYIRNLQFYVVDDPQGDPASDWDGMTLWLGAGSAYAQATVGQLTTKNSGVTASSGTYNAQNPFVINALTVLTNPSIGVGTQNYLRSQLEVGAQAINGVKRQRSMYYRWEEA